MLNCWEYGADSWPGNQDPFYIKTMGTRQDIQVNKLSPIPPWHIPELNIDLSLHNTHSKRDSSHLLKSISLDRINTTYKKILCIYTDGSRDPATGNTGASIYVPFSNSQLYSLSTVSICSAEQAAILMALNLIGEYKPLRTVIFTDSFSTSMPMIWQYGNLGPTQHTFKEKYSQTLIIY